MYTTVYTAAQGEGIIYLFIHSFIPNIFIMSIITKPKAVYKKAPIKTTHMSIYSEHRTSFFKKKSAIFLLGY